MPNNNVVAMFDRTPQAEDAIGKLEKEGFERNDISMVAGDIGGRHTDAHSGSTATSAGAGAVVGGIAGLVAGLGALAIPGIGPVIAAGPLAVAIGSLGVGAAAGGIIGALTAMNIPESDARIYVEGIRRGGALVTVKAEANRAERAREILNEFGARDLNDEESLESEHDIDHDQLSRSSRPDVPQLTRSGARVYVDGLELDPPKSRFEDFERDYRADFAGRQIAGYTYEQFSPAYRYGHDLAREPRFSGSTWTEIEGQVRRDWEDRNPGTWEQVKEVVRHAYEGRRTG